MMKARHEIKIIKNSSFFDSEWYKARYLSVAPDSISPAEHYYSIGWQVGNNPSPIFSSSNYINKFGLNNINPLLYYEQQGRANNKKCIKPSSLKVKLYDAEFSDNKVFIVMSTTLGNYFFLSVGGEAISPMPEYTFIHQKCFNSYLNKNGEYLTVFELDTNMIEQRIFVFSNDSNVAVNIEIANFVNMYQNSKIGRYIMVSNDSFSFGNREQFIKFSKKKVKGNKNEKKFLSEIMSPKTKDKVLYYETLDNKNDNAYQMFLRALENNENAYFVTSKITYNSEQNEYLKSRYIVLNTQEHKDYALTSKKQIVSWWCFPTYGYERSLISYPFLNYEFCFVPHGISYDKDSYYLHYYNFGRVEKTYCCSDFERKYLEECNGIKNVVVLGYPRMDKWYRSEINEKTAVIFPTWRKEISNSYISEICKISTAMNERIPSIKIVYIAHPSVSDTMFAAIRDKLQSISKDIVCVSHMDNKDFNFWFSTAKYLVTDYSSVAYDFSYKKEAVAIYYKPLSDIGAQYNIRSEFYSANCGIAVENTQELCSVIRGRYNKEKINSRKQAFFKFLDDDNTDRVMKDIFK